MEQAMMPKRIQLSRKRGWKMPANAINVARPGPFGNPFKIKAGLSAADKKRAMIFAVRLFNYGIRGQWSKLERAGTLNPIAMLGIIALFQAIRKRLPELRGKDLACWCRPGEPDICHGAVLLNAVNK